MPAHRALTEEEELQVTRSYVGGQSAAELAAVWQCNADTIRNIVKRRGGKLRSRGKQPGSVSSGRRGR